MGVEWRVLGSNITERRIDYIKQVVHTTIYVENITDDVIVFVFKNVQGFDTFFSHPKIVLGFWYNDKNIFPMFWSKCYKRTSPVLLIRIRSLRERQFFCKESNQFHPNTVRTTFFYFLLYRDKEAYVFGEVCYIDHSHIELVSIWLRDEYYDEKFVWSQGFLLSPQMQGYDLKQLSDIYKRSFTGIFPLVLMIDHVL